jgi:putative ABC transport system ATP-binding protein
MEKRLFRYIWAHTWKPQLWLLAVILLSMPTYFLSLDIPKQIVNGPIQGQGFATAEATGTFLRIAVPVPEAVSAAGEIVLFQGVELDRMTMLFALSGLFLFFVVVNGLIKLYINTYKGRLGERTLRRLRFELIDKVLRFPPQQFRKVKSSEVATMVKDEVEPLGGFIGDAFSAPAFLGGQALTALIFIIVQNFWLGALAGGIVALQAVVIPRLRRILIRLGRERQLTARALAGRVGEIVDGIQAVHANDTSNYERTEISERLGRIFKIRYDLYQWKFAIKFLNNFLAQVTPFFFYIIGGYLALRGQLDIGQLVAVIAAYKDLPGPVKDLIDWDQARLDVQVKYAQVVEQFTVDRMLDAEAQKLDREAPPPLTGTLAVTGLSVSDEGGARLIERCSLTVEHGEKVALLAAPGGGAEAFAETLARLYEPAAGRIAIGGVDLFEMPESVTGRRMGYASSDSLLQQGSIRDVLLYALRHAPLSDAKYEGEGLKARKWEIEEARRSGNPEYDLESDWVDYAAAGATGPKDIDAVLLKVLGAIKMADDIFDLGLRASVDPEAMPGIAGELVAAREKLRERLEAAGLSDTIAPFEPDQYNPEATIAENLLFGAPTGPLLSDKALIANPYFRSVVREHGLVEPFYNMGLEIASTVIELFRDLPPNHPFFDQLTFMSADDLPEYEALVQRLRGKDFASAPQKDRERVAALALYYVEPRHRFGLLDDDLRAKIVAARKSFRQGLPEDLKGAIEFYDPERYNISASLLDNVLFGRIAQTRADAEMQTRGVVREMLNDLGLAEQVYRLGLEFNVGVGGKRLSLGQRQRLHVARVLLKRPDIAVLNKPMTALDGRLQEQILEATLDYLKEATVLWVLSNPQQARKFARVVVFDRGAPAEDASFSTLAERKGILAGLIA